MKRKIGLVIPCFNPRSDQWTSLLAYLDELRKKVNAQIDVIVVDDGSQTWTEPPPEFDHGTQLLRMPKNLGKGAAVRRGILDVVDGCDVVAFTDFDTPYKVDDLIGVCSGILAGAHVCIGDRTSPSHYKDQRMSRHIFHRAFRLVIRMLLIGGVFDTQAGIKAFHPKVARRLAEAGRLNGFLFDLEWLYISARNRLNIRVWPVHLTKDHSSSKLRSFLNIQLIREFSFLVMQVIRRRYDDEVLSTFVTKDRLENQRLLLKEKEMTESIRATRAELSDEQIQTN